MKPRKKSNLERYMRAAILFLLVFSGCAQQRPIEKKQFTATDVFIDQDLHISVSKVSRSTVVEGTTTLVLIVENHAKGKIYYLPRWEDRIDPQRDGARIYDEHGNTFYPRGSAYYRNPRDKNSPQPNGNRVDPGANDVLVIEFEMIPESSQTLRVELPYPGTVLQFNGVPHSKP